MDRLINLLSPNTPFCKIQDRVNTIMAQMQRPISSLPCDDSPKYNYTSCLVCGNSDESNFVHDHSQGLVICQGVGQGCGYVVMENTYGDQFMCHNTDEMFNPHELYSHSSAFPSTLARANNRMQRLNRHIEKNLNRYGRDDTVTSDAYKDAQRTEAYDMLENLKMYEGVNHDTVDQVKDLFHLYRQKMYRIHKLEIALLALFYIVIHNLM